MALLHVFQNRVSCSLVRLRPAVHLQSIRLLTSHTTSLTDMHTWLPDSLVGLRAWLQAWQLALWVMPVSGQTLFCHIL